MVRACGIVYRLHSPNVRSFPNERLFVTGARKMLEEVDKQWKIYSPGIRMGAGGPHNAHSIAFLVRSRCRRRFTKRLSFPQLDLQFPLLRVRPALARSLHAFTPRATPVRSHARAPAELRPPKPQFPARRDEGREHFAVYIHHPVN